MKHQNMCISILSCEIDNFMLKCYIESFYIKAK